ncbi:hypothetical protein FA13DRAFT_1812727 [Coprinellus micaceus]|uniref:NACHT domain-containing protein n=1 Tax=Coprinellus micaceus TaxID=71717 RepID=A0A4Y7TJ73_COPMI|nr:hypothetical protein FA13DRAFT_1812727 [Coprinellus micaceus]
MAGIVSNLNAGTNYGTFSQVTTHYHAPTTGASDPTIEKLYTHVAAGSMHNSAERVDAPKCHEETRMAVQEDIFSWVSDGAPGQILWLTGPAGAGKSAIMGTVCDKLERTGHLAAAFFFSSFMGTVERKSKRGLVTTLAYQLQQHPDLDDRVGNAILRAVQRDPAIFRMSLREQMERLILRPIRASQAQTSSHSIHRMAVIIDGVDECGEELYHTSDRSKQQDQIEVLSALLYAVRDPAFPFRIIVASRPETWIREFFAHVATGKFTEIFLDNRYHPDDDIRLFFKSKFSELSRRYEYAPATWPREEDIAKLVRDASGQFIYAATVIRWIDTPGRPPQAQLDIVLSLRPLSGSNPFGVLDALYTSILKSSPNPADTVLWLKAAQVLNRSGGGTRYLPSGWTIDRLLESSAGQARVLLDLPSLVYLDKHRSPGSEGYDSFHYGRRLDVPVSVMEKPGWNTSYTFYHKTFLDFLDDSARYGNSFPDADSKRVERWLWGRFAQVLTCKGNSTLHPSVWQMANTNDASVAGGPEVPIEGGFLLTFNRCFLDLFLNYATRITGGVPHGIEEVLLESEPTGWLATSSSINSPHWEDPEVRNCMFILVHRNCRFYHTRCSPCCQRWRKEISESPDYLWKPQNSYSPLTLFLDRFCVQRIEWTAGTKTTRWLSH